MTTTNPQPSTHNPSPVPRLDLAPKRKKPLSLWNPLDYLTLLYWAFFFRQAIRWYVEVFGLPEYQKKTGRGVWQILVHDPLQRRLVIHSLLTVVVVMSVITYGCILGLQMLGVSINWRGVVFGVAFGVVAWLVGSVAGTLAFGVAGGVAIGTVFGVAYSVAFGMTGSMTDSAVFGVARSMMGSLVGSAVLGVAFAVTTGVMFGVISGEADGVSCSIAVGTVLVATFSVSVTVIMVAGRVPYSVVVGVVFSVTGSVAVVRLIEWLLAWPLLRLRKAPPPGTQLVWLPLPGYQHRIEHWLESDWNIGIHNINELLAFTLQFIPVVGAVNAVLARLPEDHLLPCVSVLTENPYDWDLVRFGSAPLKNAMWGRVLEGGLVLPVYIPRLRRYLREHFPVALRLDTSARAVCAGFWHWHEKEAEKATEAFAVVKDLFHGSEVYGIAQAIVAGQQATTLQDLAAWDSVSRYAILPYTLDELRSGTLRAMRILGEVAAEARTAHYAVAPLNRAVAIGRANAALTHLLETGADFCPEPEWPLIDEIARKWRDIVSKAGGVIGEEVLRQPVLNPYEGYSGLPVTGSTFVGRKTIISQIERHWANPGALPPLILYGHRRMGKSSILRNLDKSLPPGNLLVYLDMQNSSFVNHTGELLLDIAEAIYRVVQSVIPSEARNLSPTETRPFASLGVTAPAPEDYATLGSARRALNALLENLAPQMQGRRLILAIDEFEIVQDGIDRGRIEPEVLSYLRSRIQEHHWLALIFAGLHTLDELGRDYRSVFYGQAEHIRVSYLSEADAVDLIAKPHPDFALEYAPELRAELYRLTYGQPYLLQRLCWELVERWNERFLKQGESTPRELALDELPPILTPDFYHSAGYYFDGVWNNITEDERAVLRVMAAREALWTRDELAAVLPAINLEAVFELLHRHDIVLEDAASVRFASELLRRWIVQFSTTV